MATKKVSKPRKIKPVEVVKPVGQYTLTIQSLNKEVVVNADNPEELKQAIQSNRPTKITNQMIMTLEKGGKKVEKRLFVIQARRLFTFPINTEFFVKNLISLLN